MNIGKNAKDASRLMALASTKTKNDVLATLVRNLKTDREKVLQANGQDIEAAKEKGLNSALLERLSLRLESIVHDLEQVIALPDPIGERFEERILPNGLRAEKRRTPIGVLGVIYESRPNVTLDVSALSIKSGNCAILRGGSEVLNSNRILVSLVQQSLISQGLPGGVIQCITDPDRQRVYEMLRMDSYIDLIIPRGGEELQKFCRENSTIPVLTGGVGICHLFVDASANVERAVEVVANAKTSRPTVCNALDTLLVHAEIAPIFIPQTVAALGKKGVRFRMDAKSWPLCQGVSCQPAEPEDFETEWMSLVLGIKIVENLSEAIDHIQRHSRGHSDGILTENERHAELFVEQVDSSAVYVNASTRFTDGGELGLGAEVAVSTQKLHTRGPIGLKELTSSKWVVRGDYHLRS
jgi:glutamate-5-semialdehyde dehydrogenase